MKSYVHYISRLASETEKLLYPLKIEGGEMKVDPEHYREFIKSLGHVFRNALDHGIEAPKERVARGKDEQGRITSRFFLMNNSLVVEISDDGQGIDWKKLKEKAEEAGISLHTPGEIEQFIFPDISSTKKTLSQLWGRGVGLAVCEGRGREVRRRDDPGESTFRGDHLLLPPSLEERELSLCPAPLNTCSIS